MREIKNRWTGAVIYRSETAETVRDAVIELATKARSEGKCPDLRGSDLSGSNLRDSNLHNSNLSGSNLRGSNLRGSDLSGSNLRDSDLSGSNLRDSDLSGSNLRDSNLSGSNLRDSNLRDSNLSGSNLRGSNLRGSDLSGSNLRGSNLRGSNLRDSNLRGSNLRDSDLRDSNLSDSNLSGSNLSGSNLRDSNLRDSNLSEIRDDVWRVLDAAPTEALELLYAVREGRINGSAYTGECACLVGTVANLRSCSVYELPMEIRPDSSREAERWFLGMRPGDTPEHHPVSRITAEWIEEWMRAHDVAVPRAMTFAQAAAFARANIDAFEAFASAGT